MQHASLAMTAFDPMSIHTRSRLANTDSGSISSNQSAGSANRLQTQRCSAAVEPSKYDCMYNANRSRSTKSGAKESVHGYASHTIACRIMTANLKAFCSCIQVACSNRGPPCSRAAWAAHSCRTLTSIAWLCSVRDCNNTSNHVVAIVLFTCTSWHVHLDSHRTETTAANLAHALKRLISHTHNLLCFMHEHSCATVDSESALKLRHKPPRCSRISQLQEQSHIWAFSIAQCDQRCSHLIQEGHSYQFCALLEQLDMQAPNAAHCSRCFSHLRQNLHSKESIAASDAHI